MIRKLCFIFLLIPAHAGAEAITTTPVISIIIDDIGYRKQDDLHAMSLPGPIAYAILPQTQFSWEMSRLASKKGKTVLLHLPMEAVEEDKNRFLGPGGLTMDMTREQFMRTLDIDLRSVPDAIGVNNHMGSLLTRHPGYMEWLMKSLDDNNKFYIDSYTSKQSIARLIAAEQNVPYLRRDIFLDNQQDAAYIKKQFEKLIKAAKRKGKAIAIGHPHPVTIQVLAGELRDLEKRGVMLVNLLDIVPHQKIKRVSVE